uniref:Uncharacterized protein n=1 Tax=Amphimedon queenslandica TaxID=400682 RepID=A0A1X7VE23_AMPQE
MDSLDTTGIRIDELYPESNTDDEVIIDDSIHTIASTVEESQLSCSLFGSEQPDLEQIDSVSNASTPEAPSFSDFTLNSGVTELPVSDLLPSLTDDIARLFNMSVLVARTIVSEFAIFCNSI